MMLLTRETVRDQPQYHIRTLSATSNGAPPAPERLLSSFPHPYPSIRDLQKEVIRCAPLPAGRPSTSQLVDELRPCP